MKTLRSIAFVAMLGLATPLLAQGGHQHHGGASADAPTPDVAEIAPAPPAKGGCDKCKKMGMGDKMSHGGGMGGAGGCKHMKGGGAADTASLERRIDELEKRLDLMQLLLQREAR
jgi:hypothetical protein